MNIGGIVNRLDTRITLIQRKHALQKQIDELADRQRELDEGIREQEEQVAAEMKIRGKDRLSYRGIVYKILCMSGYSKPDRLSFESCLTLSEADRESQA